jgi:hypothetical protein
MFYIGTALMGITLWFTLSRLVHKRVKLAFILVFMTLYNGSGNYHGFYWVVPSFFSVMLFLLLFGLLFHQSRKWLALVILSTLLFILVHPLSLYATLIFPIFALTLIFFQGKKMLGVLWRSLVVFTSSVGWFITSRVYFIFNGIKIESESSIIGIKRALANHFAFLQRYTSELPARIAQLEESANKKQAVMEVLPASHLQLSNLEVIRKEYLDVLFPHPIFIAAFLVIVISVLLKRSYWIIALYISAVIFVILSSISWFGFRSVSFLWPQTFLLIGAGIYSFGELVVEKSPQIIKNCTLLVFAAAVLMLIVIVSVFNVVWAKNMRLRYDIPFDTSCVAFLSEKITPDQWVYFDSRRSMMMFNAYGMFNMERVAVNYEVVDLMEGYYVVSTYKNNTYYSPEHPLIRNLLAQTTRQSWPPLPEWEEPNDQFKPGIKVRDCGGFQVRKVDS